jgi:hypothetical protein
VYILLQKLFKKEKKETIEKLAYQKQTHNTMYDKMKPCKNKNASGPLKRACTLLGVRSCFKSAGAAKLFFSLSPAIFPPWPVCVGEGRAGSVDPG